MFRSLVLSAALCATALPSHAQTPSAGTDAASRRRHLDANGDGAIDRSEAAGAPKLLANFDRIDANHDGRITRDERPHREGHDGQGHGARGAKLDTDGDHRLSRQEAAGRPRLAGRFDAIDADRDGYLTREEMHRYREQHRGEAKDAPRPAR